ncbi:MAG: hopanoid biosynthesis-associated protein HpnK [Syntrophobacteraceae bacterium]|nr:hopanoid biosynthesis-associated protein HpnK [Syntrophobacteraceae bacterium]
MSVVSSTKKGVYPLRDRLESTRKGPCANRLRVRPSPGSIPTTPARKCSKDIAKKLIFNADDFGASEPVNLAVLRAFKEGVLTSCSLMVSGQAFEHAVRIAGDLPGLAVGIHLVTVMGSSVLPPAWIPHLVDGNGNFPVEPGWTGLKYQFSRRARQELRRELEAQFEKFAATGLLLSHIDSHLHMHVHPVVFDMVLELGLQFGARAMRVPADDLSAFRRYEGRVSPGVWTSWAVFQLLTRRMRKILPEKRFVFCERVYGHLRSGRMEESYVLSLLDGLLPGTHEIYLHPALAHPGDSLSLDQGQAELEVFLSPRVKERIRQLNIRTTTYRGLEDKE